MKFGSPPKKSSGGGEIALAGAPAAAARLFSFLLFAGAPILLGCGGDTRRPHSILNSAGPQAKPIEWLWWVMFIAFGIVFLITILLLVWSLAAPKRDRPVLGFRFVLLTGIVIPTVILIGLLISELKVDRAIMRMEEDFRVQVIGHGWWFEVNYPDYGIVDANEIHVPANRTVCYELSSSGMIHSFWIPRLGGKRDQLPDHVNHLHLEAGEPGIYHGVCTEYCAGQHARMGFRLVAHTADDFENWAAQKRTTMPALTDSGLIRGRSVFLQAGCASCHSIKGLSRANIGPDLTHMGSRLTLGAGQFSNSPGMLAGWIANSQALKPGNRMPRTYLQSESLHVLTSYLQSLK